MCPCVRARACVHVCVYVRVLVSLTFREFQMKYFNRCGIRVYFRKLPVLVFIYLSSSYHAIDRNPCRERSYHFTFQCQN